MTGSKTIFQDPAAYGFQPPLRAPYLQVYCDGAHFTLASNVLYSQECYRSLTPPLRVCSAVVGADGDLVIRWTGGASPFLVQRATNLSSGRWEPVGPLQESSEAVVKRDGVQGFFRIVFLGQ